MARPTPFSQNVCDLYKGMGRCWDMTLQEGSLVEQLHTYLIILEGLKDNATLVVVIRIS